MSAIAGSIPLDTEILVHIAYRFRGAEFAEPHGVWRKYRVRTPAEMEHAVEEVEEAMWNGTLQSIRGHSRRSPEVQR